MKKRVILILCTAAVLLGACKKEEPLKIVYFYSIYCPACEITETLENLAGKVATLGKSRGTIEVECYDVFKAKEFDLFYEYIEEKQVPQGSRDLPILFINDDYYQGIEDIESALQKIQS